MVNLAYNLQDPCSTQYNAQLGYTLRDAAIAYEIVYTRFNSFV